MNSFSYVNSLTSLIFLIIIISLQVFLSKKENKILGLILPTISFLFTILFAIQTTSILISIAVLALLNIPTIILLAIYFSCRKKINKNKEINKMNIQDLE